MERSTVKFLIAAFCAAIMVSCGIDAKRNLSGPEATGSLAPRVLFKKSSSQATVTIPPAVATVSITLSIGGRDTTVSAPRSQGYIEFARVPVGNCPVTVEGKDLSGRVVFSGAIVATILENQTASPQVTLVQAVPAVLYYDSPRQNMTVSDSVITLTGTITFAQGVSLAPNGFLINGSAPVQTGLLWTKDVTLLNGSNKFKFIIVTNQGNILRDTLTVNYSRTSVDVIGPSLTVNEVGDTIQSSSITIQGTVSDPTNPVRVNINGVAAAVSGNQFALMVSLSTGKNTLVVDAYDSLNNKTTQTLSVVYSPMAVDVTNPDLQITAPVDSVVIATTTVHVSGTASDAAGVTVTVNGQTATIDQLGNWSADVTADSTYNHIVIVATDKSTQRNAFTVTRVVRYNPTVTDTVPPVVAIKAPNNLTTTSIDSIEVSVEAIDAISNIASVTINGLAAVFNSIDSRYSKTIRLTAGTNTVTAIATDTKGNKDTATITVTYNPAAVDNIPPQIVWVYPAPNDILGAASITVQVKPTDLSGIASVKINNLTAVRDSVSQIFSAVVNLSAGANTITAEVTDASPAHNAKTGTISVTCDPTASDNLGPTIVVVDPASNSTVYTGTYSVKTRVTDNSGVDSVKYTTSTDTAVWVKATAAGNNEYIATVNFVSPGSKMLTIMAWDKSTAKNMSVKTSVLTYSLPDNIRPTLSRDLPVQDTVAGAIVTLRLTATDLSGIDSVMVNGRRIPLVNSQYVKVCTLTTVGANIFTYVAFDASVNHNVLNMLDTIYYYPSYNDTAKPQITRVLPSTNTVTAGIVTIKLTVTDTSGIDSVTVNAKRAILQSGNDYLATCTLSTGINRFTYKAYDKSIWHNVSTKADSITFAPLDTTKPVVTITSPAANITVNTNTATIVATITDAGGIAKVRFNNDSTSFTVAGTTYSYPATLNLGNNIFRIYARDVAGNVDSSKTVTIVYATAADTIKPVVTITSPAANITVNTNTAIIVATITDAGGIAQVKFNNDSTGATVAGITYTYVATLTAGANVFRIKARDAAGNLDTSKSVTITYNTPPAAPTLFTPVTVSATSITVRWTKSADPDFNRYKLFWGLTASVGEGNALGIDSAITTNSDTVRTLSALTPATVYFFKVAVRDGFPSTTYSSVVMDTTPLAAPAITSVTIQSTAPFAPRITWTKAPGATRYDVHRSVSSTFASYEAIGATLAVNDTTLLDTSSGVPYAAGTKYYYRVVASNSLVLNSQSGIDSVTTWQAPAFTTQPLSQTKMVGQNVVFTVVASGFPAPTYQWKKNGNTISGATGASYTIGAVSLADSGLYTVTASSNAGSIISNQARLTAVDSILVDIEGNVYHTVIIGNQVWTKENLRVTKYNDNTAIPPVTDSATWRALNTPAYCYYNNMTNVDSIKKWGALYNWYVVNPANVKKIAPAGWHVPTDAEWAILDSYLVVNGYSWDSSSTSGSGIAKSLAAKTDWQYDPGPGVIGNILAENNRSLFSALPGGWRIDGSFSSIGTVGCWWTTTAFDATYSYYSLLRYFRDYRIRGSDVKRAGVSVRLVRD